LPAPLLRFRIDVFAATGGLRMCFDPTPPLEHDRGESWRALGAVAILLAVELATLAALFGPQLLAIPGKRWAVFAAVMVLGGLQAHVRHHRDAYRGVRISWPLLAGQTLAFAGVLAAAAWLHAGAQRTILGDAGDAVAGATLAVAWLVTTLAAIAPRLSLAMPLLRTVLAFAMFATAAWFVGDLTKSFWDLTSDSTLRLVELLLTPFAGRPVVRPSPFVIGTSDFSVLVTASCGGFHGIGLVTVLLVGYLWWFRRVHRFPQSLVLVPIGVVLMWLANVVRITALILVGIWLSPDIAVEGFHSAAGWIAFLTVGLGLILVAARMPFFVRPDSPNASDSLRPAALSTGQVPVTDSARIAPNALACLLPFLALTATTLVAQAFSSGFDALYPVRVLVVIAVLWRLRRSLPWRECRISPAAVAIGAATFALWMILAPGPSAAPAAAARDPSHLGQPWSTLWLLFRVAGSTVTVPVAEELFFRGFVIRRCIGEDVDGVPIGVFTWFSFLLSSVAFGLLHGDAWIAGTVAGMLFACALYTRKNLCDAVVAHATTNALLSGYVVATGSWSQWG